MNGTVRPLADGRLVDAWEAAAERSAIERAPAILAAALDPDDLAQVDGWPVGRSDAALLDLHSALFGGRIAGVTACPACLEDLELDFAVENIRAPHGDGTERLEAETESGHGVVFRLPTVSDLAYLGRRATRRSLAESCVVEAFVDGEPIAAAALPESVVGAIDALMAARDPQG